MWENLNASARRGSDELFGVSTRFYERFVVADYERVDTRNLACFFKQYERKQQGAE
jgi:hypothetical protein